MLSAYAPTTFELESPRSNSAMARTGVCQTHENKKLGVRVRGTSFGLERGSAAEPQLASPSDGRATLERAIAALKADEAAALKAFNDEKNKDFRDRDLYVYCFSLPDGNITAYQSPVMIRTNVKKLKLPPNNPLANAPTTPLQRPPKARSSALLTISPSLAPRRPRLRRRSKP